MTTSPDIRIEAVSVPLQRPSLGVSQRILARHAPAESDVAHLVPTCPEPVPADPMVPEPPASPIRTSAPSRRPGTASAPVHGDDELLSTVRALASSIIEVLLGGRPAEQVRRWVEPEVMERLEAQTALRLTLAPRCDPVPVRVGSTLLQTDGPEEAQACVVIRTPTRTRAVSMQLRRRGRRWRVAAVETA